MKNYECSTQKEASMKCIFDVFQIVFSFVVYFDTLTLARFCAIFMSEIKKK